MSEPVDTSPVTAASAGASGAAATAGAMLRQARVAQGVHIAVLAASIKVTQRKLESLEADRYDELPDATFARALAQAVCRSLKVDPAPVLALLPHSSGLRLEHVSEGLNTPFREPTGRSAWTDIGHWLQPRVLAPLLLLAAAALIYWLPAGSLRAMWPAAPASGAASAAVAAVSPGTLVEAPVAADAPAALPLPEVVPAAPAAPSADALAASPAASAEAPGASIAASAAPAAAISANEGPPVLTLRARSSATWVELQDATGRLVISRLLKPEEVVTVDERQPPLKLKVGNAAVTEVEWRGRPLDLKASARDNVARLELQ
jgi:cytoskeleton protein RodZ